MEWISVAALLSIPLILLIGWFRGWSMLLVLTVTMAVLFVISLLTGIDRLTLRGSPLLADLAWQPAYLDLAAWPHWYTLVSTMFLHSDPLHLLMNLVIFIIMGIGLEERIGRGRFLAVFLFSGAVGTILHSLAVFGSTVPVVGASGAVFGVMGAYATLYPRDKVFFFFILIIPNVPVYIAAVVYTGVELVYFVLNPSPGVAHHAHIGGLIGGVFFAALLMRFAQLPGHEKKIRRHRKALTRGTDEVSQTSRPSSAKAVPISSLVETEEQSRLYKRLIENRDEPELAAAWLERLAASTVCPRCGSVLVARAGAIKCQCGYEARDEKS